MTIKFAATQQGAKLGVFNDLHNNECSFQGDNINGQSVIWLGVTRDFQGNMMQRMVLDRQLASVLTAILQEFLATGNVPTCPEEMPKSLSIRQSAPPTTAT